MTLDKLEAFGANIHEGMTRCMNNEAFYLQMVENVLQDDTFEALRQNISKNDLGAAFDSAHYLKGSLATLAITPLYEPICEITEMLRAREDADYAPLVDHILRKREELRSM